MTGSPWSPGPTTIHNESVRRWVRCADPITCPGNGLTGHRLIPGSDLNGWIVHQSSQSPTHTQQVCFSWNLIGHFAQVYRAACVQSHQHPTKGAEACDPFSWTKCSIHLVTSMVKFWYWHDAPCNLVSGHPSLLDYHAFSFSLPKTVW